MTEAVYRMINSVTATMIVGIHRTNIIAQVLQQHLQTVNESTTLAVGKCKATW